MPGAFVSSNGVFFRMVGWKMRAQGPSRPLHIWSTTALMRKLFENTENPYNFLALRPKVVEEHTCGDLEKAWTQAGPPSFFSMAL